MPFTRASLKNDAKLTIKYSKPSIISVSLLYTLLLTLMSYLSQRVLYGRISVADAQRYLELINNGSFDMALQYAEYLRPTGAAQGVDMLLTIVTNIVGAGFTIFLLNSIRHTAPCLENLLDGFGIFLKVIILHLLTSIFIALWSMLLFIPGIIAFYSYRMALYLMIDHPELSVGQCIKESKRMMKGHKLELFKLDLSFIGWSLLEMLPIIGYGVRVWTVPYVNTTRALYYERLCGRPVYTEPSADADYTDWQ